MASVRSRPPNRETRLMRQTSRFFVLAAAAVGLAACEDTNAPASLDRDINLAVAQASGQTVANDLTAGESLRAEATGTGSFLGLTDGGMHNQQGPNGTPRAPNGCVLNPTLMRFDCGRSRRSPASGLGERDYTRSVQFFDGAGAVQAGYDSITTARIVWLVADTGGFSRRRGTAMLADSSARSSRRELSNLAGHPDTLHIWNGEGSSFHLTSRPTATGMVQTVTMFATDTTSNLRYRLPRSQHPYPVAGIIVRNVEVSRVRTSSDSVSVNPIRSRRVMIEFNGTSTATMTVNGQVFDLDLATGEVTPRSA